MNEGKFVDWVDVNKAALSVKGTKFTIKLKC